MSAAMNQSAEHMGSHAAGTRAVAAAGAAAAGAARSGDRLRWGLTGLAAIFLVVMIAAASLQPTSRSERPGSGESLAVLGVAPGPASRPAGD
jgi:hypothetical protein